MPLSASLSSDPGVAGPLGTLAMSLVLPKATTLALRARAWQRDLDRLGVMLPFSFIHDVGLLFAAPREQLNIRPRCDFSTLVSRVPGATELYGAYREVIEGVA